MSNTDETTQTIKFAAVVPPSVYMRAARPDEFSDTERIQRPTLDRNLLEYKLSTLTSRSEEKQFEHFARKIAERLLCPNLIPQTGPTGGGDSKTDTETYPVAEEVSERWYSGIPGSGDARWAFAFSAKKAWQGKVRSDIASIASTGRSYALAYFISNQPISDRNRAKLEDELTNKHGLKVRILSRDWLLEAVFEKGCLEIAAEALALTGISDDYRRLGAGDAVKREKLNTLESQITDQDRYRGVEYQLVEDCLLAAIVSRELELPRHETDGRFDRAVRLAKKYGNEGQRIHALYQKAWTAIFWFDDFDPSITLYEEIETYALASSLSEDIERPANLLQCLRTASRHDVDEQELQLQKREQRLLDHLEQLSSDPDRPNNAANCKGLLISLRIMQPNATEEGRRRALLDLADLLCSSNHLGGFQFERNVTMLEVMEPAIRTFAEHDEAWERVLPVIESRSGEVAVGDRLYDRGIKKLSTGNLLDGIDLLGRALPKLLKAERQLHLSRCLTALSVAYLEIDLIWAAHSNLLSAFNVLMEDFRRARRWDPLLPSVFEKLFWMEVSAGRLPQALWYLDMFISTKRQSADHDEADADWQEAIRVKDGVLAMLILKADAQQITGIARMLDFFERVGLVACALSTLFSVGGPDALRAKGYLPDDRSDQDVWDLLKLLWRQPAQSELPSEIETFEGGDVSFVSHVLGTEWRVICENNTWSVRLGESFLSFMEAFLATSLRRDVTPLRERVTIRVKLMQTSASEESESGLRFSPDDRSILGTIEIDRNRFPIGGLHTERIREFFIEILAAVLPRVLMAGDFESFMEAVAGSEGGLVRATLFADVLATASNVFPDGASPTLDEWQSAEAPALPLADPPYNVRLQAIMSLSADVREEPVFGPGTPPPELLTRVPKRHRQQQVLSKINSELWDEAKWSGVLVAVYPRQPPLLGLLFRNRDAAIGIFEEWLAELGDVDYDEQVRVSILTGVNKSYPSTYTVVIGSSMSRLERDESQLTYLISRLNTMDNPNPINLAQFRAAYQHFGAYCLVPVAIDAEMREPELLVDYSILKSAIEFREAWTIGENDPDCVGIRPGYDPVIPEGQTEAPVLALLARLRSGVR